MDKVKQLVAAGMTLPDAIKEAIEGPLYLFADRHKLSRPMSSEMVNLVRSATLPFCRALTQELGGTPYEWAVLLWEASRPHPRSFPDLTEVRDAAVA